MRSGWEIRKLKEITTKIGSGATPKGGQSSYKKSGISLIRSMNVYDEGFTEKKLAFIDEKQAQKLNNVTIEEGDILLNITGASVARCCIVPNEFLPARVNQHVAIIRLKKNLVTKEFLQYLLISKNVKDKLLGIGDQGSTRQAITKSQLEGFEVSFPSSIVEQKQIVAILDEAFEAIDQAKANIEKNIQNAQELFQSRLDEVFSHSGEGWEEKKLKEVCDGFQYGTSSKSYLEGDIPVLRMGNIQDGKIDWEKLKFTSDPDEIEKYFLQENDVLFNRTNSPELVGKSAIYEGDRAAIFAGYLIRVVGKEDVLDNEFLNYFLNSPQTRGYGFSVMSSSVNQANINASKLKEYKIPVPSIDLQKQFVEELNKLKQETDLLASLYKDKISALEELKKSLLQKAFSGELTKNFSEEVKDLVAS
jgi:type I restriction enzyme S subunit